MNVAAPLVGVHPLLFSPAAEQPAEHENAGTEAPLSLKMCAPHRDWASTHGKLVRYVEQRRLFAGADKRGPMRALVDPPPSLRCDLCNGELRLKKIEQDASPLESDVTTFVCAKCGHEKSYRVSRDPHSAPRAEAAPAPTTTAPTLEQTGGADRKKAGAAKP